MVRPRHTELAGRRSRALRREMTVSEARVWQAISNRQTGARFRRQVPIGIWIVAFASLCPKLVLEIDDLSHDWRDEDDRCAYLEAAAFPVLRFTNREVAEDLPAVFNTIALWVAELNQGRRPR